MMNVQDYIKHHYGTCDRVQAGQSCACLKHGWIGADCYSWSPLQAETWEELAEAQKKMKNISEEPHFVVDTSSDPV